MRTLVVTLTAATVIVCAGALAWQADAAPWRGAATVGIAVESVNPVEEVACRGWGRCPPGRYWGCGARGCWCRPC
jgi:hypothetical protein